MVVVVVEQTSCCTGFLVRYSGDDDVDDDVEDCFLTCFFLCGLHDFWGAQADLVPWLVFTTIFWDHFLAMGDVPSKTGRHMNMSIFNIHIIYVSSMFLVHVGIDYMWIYSIWRLVVLASLKRSYRYTALANYEQVCTGISSWMSVFNLHLVDFYAKGISIGKYTWHILILSDTYMPKKKSPKISTSPQSLQLQGSISLTKIWTTRVGCVRGIR